MVDGCDGSSVVKEAFCWDLSDTSRVFIQKDQSAEHCEGGDSLFLSGLS